MRPGFAWEQTAGLRGRLWRLLQKFIRAQLLMDLLEQVRNIVNRILALVNLRLALLVGILLVHLMVRALYPRQRHALLSDGLLHHKFKK